MIPETKETKETMHRMTWRGYCAFYVNAANREAAIAKAIVDKPDYIPAGTELHYGVVTVSRNAVTH